MVVSNRLPDIDIRQSYLFPMNLCLRYFPYLYLMQFTNRFLYCVEWRSGSKPDPTVLFNSKKCNSLFVVHQFFPDGKSFTQ